jgi:Lon-like protease
MRRVLQLLAPAAALAICLYVVELPLFVESPGSARSVLPLIDVDGTETFGSRGELLLTTVSLGRANVYDALAAWVDADIALLQERDILAPGQTDREYEQQSVSQMDQSKIAASAVVLESLTDYPTDHRPGVIVQDVVPDTPAAGRLFSGDLITSIDGDQVRGVAELRRRIDDAGTTHDLQLRVRPIEGGQARRVVIRPVVIEGQDGPVIGIVSVANFPFDITISSDEIGGPSAGMMWALGLTDLLTPEDLTDGRDIAGTGTVDLEGGVGPIGGVRLKILAAEEAGADVFLVPEANMAEARGAGDDIDLVSVATVDQAVGALEDDG